MPGAAIIAAALSTPRALRASLWIASNDVLKQPGMTGNGYGVPIETIEVDEQGPGGISSLTFTIDDPTGTATLPQDGDEVRFHDHVANLPYFGGLISSWAVRPGFGGQGRSIDVRCDGYEVILDWAIIPVDMTFATGTLPADAVQGLIGNAQGQGALRDGMVLLTGSSQAHPISSFGTTTPLPYAVTVTAGTSLRAAIDQVTAPNAASRGGFNALCTVDFYRGVRLFEDSPFGSLATDYLDLTVTDTTAGPRAAENLRHQTDATSIVRGVYVTGANAAGTGFLGDGSGKPGRIAYLTDSTIDTAAKLLDAQQTYLNATVLRTSGDLALTDWTPPGEVRPGSLLILTDAATGASGMYRIMQITKRFTGARESWRIAYGKLRPSATALIRNLTRDVRS
jgi:hypothetical protein